MADFVRLMSCVQTVPQRRPPQLRTINNTSYKINDKQVHVKDASLCAICIPQMVAATNVSGNMIPNG